MKTFSLIFRRGEDVWEIYDHGESESETGRTYMSERVPFQTTVPKFIVEPRLPGLKKLEVVTRGPERDLEI